MSNLSKRHFWEWFKRHNQEYLELNKKSKKEAHYWLQELDAHLRAYFKFLGYSVSLPDGKDTARLTITVNGRAMHFKKADAFVSTAPEIPGWSICSLEDPMPIDFLLDKHMERAGIHPSELFFSFANYGMEDVDLIVYHPLCTKHNGRLISELAYAAVYNLLGERSFGMDIGHLEVGNLSLASLEDVYKMEELPTRIGLRQSAMLIDHNGTLLSM